MSDIPLFVKFFVNKYGKRIGKNFDIVPHEAIERLQSYDWPGNIRELENIIERSVIMSPNEKLHIEIPTYPDNSIVQKETLREIEREHILKILNKTHWRINGPKGAAQLLDLHPNTLRFRMKKLSIQRQ